MIPILAQYAPSFTAGQLAAFVGILFFVFALIIAARKVFGHEPPLHKEYVTKADHDRDFRLLRDDLTKGAGSRKQMHEKLEALASEQSALRQENESQSRDLQDVKREINGLHARIDSVPERTIRLLNETRQLHK